MKIFNWLSNLSRSKKSDLQTQKVVKPPSDESRDKEACKFINNEKNHPIVERKTNTIIVSEHIVGIAAIFGGKFSIDDERVKERINLYNELNPGFNKIIKADDFFHVFSTEEKDIVSLISIDLIEQISKKYGKTSKIIQVGKTMAYMTIVRVKPEEPEKIEFLDFKPNSIQFM